MKFLALSSVILAASLAHGQSIVDKAKKLYEEKKWAEAEKLLTPIDDEDKDYAAAQYYLGHIKTDVHQTHRFLHLVDMF